MIAPAVTIHNRGMQCSARGINDLNITLIPLAFFIIHEIINDMTHADLILRKHTLESVVRGIRTTYPFQTRERMKRFDRLCAAFEKKLPMIQTDREFFLLLERLIVSLRDSHTNLASYPTKKFFAPPGYKIEMVGRDVHLFKRGRWLGKILSIGGSPIKSLMSLWAKRVAASSKQFRSVRVKDSLRLNERNTPLEVMVQTTNKRRIRLSLACRKIVPKTLSNRDIVSARVIDGIGYLRISTWSGEYSQQIKSLCDSAFDGFTRKNVRALIIDVRGNQGGDSKIAAYIAGRFFTNRVLFGVTKTRISKSNLRYRTIRAHVEPRQPHIPFPLILLVDAYCHSSNEYFIAGLKDNKQAILIGQTTAGGSGNPTMVEIPYRESKLKVRIATWRYYRAIGAPLERKGIKPNIIVKPTIEDLKNGRDVVLERAIKKAKQIQAPI